MTQNRHDTPPPLRSFDQDRTILEDASGRADTPPGARERVAQLTVVWSEAERAEALRSHAEGGTRDAFLLRRLLGRGGFGEVYEGIQRSLGRVVAVKRLRPDVTHLGSSDARGDYLRRAFRQEAMTASLLEHPNIVPVYEYHEDAHGPLLAMKLVRGTPWDAMLAEDFVTMPVEAFLHKHVQILEEIGQAVAFAHSRGVVHRDLKPSQAMIGEFGEVQLMDWGLAVLVDAGRIEEAGLSRHALLIPGLEFASSPAGTPAFMAPEQAQPDARGVGTWTDVYLLGATL
jgi:serine/threonine-protein kinase